MTAVPCAIDQILDLIRYPLDHPGCPGYEELLAGCRRDLRSRGCAKIPGFLRADAVPFLAAEADRAAVFAHRSFTRTNPYFSADDPALPPEHPRRRFFPRTNAFVPADNFGGDSLLRQIYAWQPFMDFIQAALEEESFYRYADPLADVIVNAVDPAPDGNTEGFPWHFDTNDYTVTLALQSGDGGGLFEYCPNFRRPNDENYAGVQAVLDGDRAPVETLALVPGDLQIFRGRNALHRVTPLTGTQPRYVAIFSFVDEPGMVARVERCRQLYGKVLPVHLEREAARRQDGLRD